MTRPGSYKSIAFPSSLIGSRSRWSEVNVRVACSRAGVFCRSYDPSDVAGV
jgi:hypothetical protein